ncbi:MAG: prolyl oligopeptidase family serine peptidase, partial [Actinobacteria bacterium]|nr:prolyl oligopeptidase family serine peptidase [Actinomycetota bacterium]
DGYCTPDGEGVVWFHDSTGDEVGHWLVEPFVTEPGAPSARRLLAPGVVDAWSTGLAMGDDLVVVGTATDDGFAVHVSRGDGDEVRVLHRHPDTVEVADLSWDSGLLCLQHAEHGDAIHLAARIIDPVTGDVVGEQWDGPGLGLTVAGWAPVAGDQRVALVHERDGRDRPAVWDLATGERRDLAVDLPGDVNVVDWWPDGSGLLLVHDHEGRHRLWRLDLTTEVLEPVIHEVGSVSGAGVRPDGEVWLRVSNGAVPPTVQTPDGVEVCAAEGERPAGGVTYQPWWFTDPATSFGTAADEEFGPEAGTPAGPAGPAALHGFVAAPSGPGPHPTLMLVHGGPDGAYTDAFSPEVQAWVDHGVAVAMVNYRGSTGYGTAFRDALIGDPGFPEVADLVAGVESVVGAGVADPARVAVGGGSWGGYVSLLAIGLHPDRWAAAVAVVPVGDYVAAYADESPELQEYDRTLFGGSPEEVGDLYRERSPLTYVDRVRTPVLVIAGDNDSRCPIRQVVNYVEALRE